MERQQQIQLSVFINASADTLFQAWLSSKEHTAFTGGEAKIDYAIGGVFTAWDDYITGTTIELEIGKRILQKWRTTEFPEDAPDSFLELEFTDEADGCKMQLTQWNIPEDQVGSYASGWMEHYFEPMQTYFK